MFKLIYIKIPIQNAVLKNFSFETERNKMPKTYLATFNQSLFTILKGLGHGLKSRFYI